MPLLRPLPLFAVRAHFGDKGPGIFGLMRQVKDFCGDALGLDEEIIRRVAVHLARPWHIDYGIDDQVSHVNPFGPQVPGQRLGENALRGLGGREPGKVG